MKESHTKDKGNIGLDRELSANAWWDFFVNEVVLPEHLFHIYTIPGPTRCYRFPTFQFEQMKPTGKLNASVGEHVLLGFLLDENALVWSVPELQLFRGSSSLSFLV